MLTCPDVARRLLLNLIGAMFDQKKMVVICAISLRSNERVKAHEQSITKVSRIQGI